MSVPVARRFWSKTVVQGAEDCWEWQATKVHNGYGQFWLDGAMQLAHRVAYELENGPVPEGLVVRHKCDNPGCVNPCHLELGTHTDNAADREQRGRGRQPRGEANSQAKLTEAEVRNIRARYASGEPQNAIASSYGVSAMAVNLIVHRRKWAHVD